MQGNNHGVGFGMIKFFMGCLDSHKNYILCYSRTDDILFHLTVSKVQFACGPIAQSAMIDVALAGSYILSEAEVLEFHNDFPTAKIIVLGGNWCKYTAEAGVAANQLGLKIMLLKEFLSAVYSRSLL